MYPPLLEIVAEFEQMIVWKAAGEGSSEDIPEPKPGLDLDFDEANHRVNKIKEILQQYLDTVKAELMEKNPKSEHPRIIRLVNYANVKQRYEIEVPIDLVQGQKKPSSLELTSFKQGFQRFQTDKLRGLVE